MKTNETNETKTRTKLWAIKVVRPGRYTIYGTRDDEAEARRLVEEVNRTGYCCFTGFKASKAELLPQR